MPNASVAEEEKVNPLRSESSLNLLQLFNSYSNPFSRFTSTASLSSPNIPGGLSTTTAKEQSKEQQPKLVSANGEVNAGGDAVRQSIADTSPLRRLRSVSSLGGTVVSVATAPRYSLSSLLLVALIAFLLGSLLRSLLSPADFIYVVNDMSDAPDRLTGQLRSDSSNQGLRGLVEPGWREIRRLFEIKYIMGGWDFQVAVVRRH